MAYTRQNLQDGDILHGSNLSLIEDELVALDNASSTNISEKTASPASTASIRAR